MHAGKAVILSWENLGKLLCVSGIRTDPEKGVDFEQPAHCLQMRQYTVHYSIWDRCPNHTVLNFRTPELGARAKRTYEFTP